MTQITIPKPAPPAPLEGYWSADTGKLLAWEHVSQRMEAAKNYWISTVNPNGRPHTVPVWGVWVDDMLHFGGSPDTRWARNLAQQPYVVAHLDDSDKAVIIEGRVTRLTDPDSPQMTRLDDVYEVKYNMRHGPPIFQLFPAKVMAWQSMDTVTRWLFENDEEASA